MTRDARSFEVTDENGNTHTIIWSQSVVNESTIDDRGTTRPGLREYFTSNGERVNAKADGTFQIVGSDLILRRVP